MQQSRHPSLVIELGRRLVRKRDFYAGGLMILFGLVMVLKGPAYRVGSLMHMGPGFLPTVLGVILVFLGIVIAAGANSPVTIVLGLVAVTLATTNVVGGFVVTDRMLEMFKGRQSTRPTEPVTPTK